MLNPRKVAIVGCGFVGSSIAFSLMQRGIYSEIVLIDANHARAEGEALDLSHGLPYTAAMDIYAGDYKDVSDCSLIIITAGANQKPGETRLDLIGKNVAILKSIIPQITAEGFEGILMIVSNPVDVLTYAAREISGYPAHRVISSGTVLDTARLKYILGRHLDVDSRSVHAVIIGEHGDSELAVWSGANVSGIDLNHFCEIRGHFRHDESMQRIYEDVRDSAYEIIKRKGATYYGIAMAVARIAECIVKDEQAVLPVSVILEGAYGLSGLALSIPSVVGKNTYAAREISGYPAHRVIGSGTVLDTARLKYILGRHLDVDSRSVHAVIIGEHGDSELAVWSGANVSGIDLNHFCEIRGHFRHDESMQRIYEDVRDSAYEIIKRKGATYYGIAMAVARIAECIVKDEQAVLPVSVILEGAYGLSGLALSIPSVVGKNGVEKVLEIPLNDQENQALHSSAKQLLAVISELKL